MIRIGRNGGERIQIRSASKSDAEAINEVHIAAKREAYCDPLPAEDLASIRRAARDRADQWRDHLAGDSSSTLIAEVDGHIAGFVNLDACQDDDMSPETVGEVTAIFVRPEEWGQGIGEALMREAMARLRDGGWVEVALWVMQSNRRAVGYY
jgi:ribosomal protein S18 acetylase RimI-like enzyme